MSTDRIKKEKRDLLFFQAQLCEQAGRYEDMVDSMRRLCQTYDEGEDKGDLSIDERDLLSCAYKNVIGSRRTSWRILNEILKASSQATTNSNEEQQQGMIITTINKKQETKYNIAVIESILRTIESELKTHCGNIIEILNDRLIPSVSATGESRVFYYKMKGDYMRYLCEISSDAGRKEKANESLLAYKTASDEAMVELPPTHPVRLGLMLNFSVFYYDIMKSPERSCRIAKQAFDDAIAELDTLSEESYRDSTIIMQLLRDNLNLWESEQNLQSTNESN